MSAVVSRHLSAQLRASAIPHLPTFRAKAPDSLRDKLVRDVQEHEFSSLEREFGPSIKDLAGVRILLYRPRDQDQTCRVIEELFASFGCSQGSDTRKPGKAPDNVEGPG